MDKDPKTGLNDAEKSPEAEKVIEKLNDFIKNAKENDDYNEEKQYEVPEDLALKVEPVLKGLKKKAYDIYFGEREPERENLEDLDDFLGVDVDKEDYTEHYPEDGDLAFFNGFNENRYDRAVSRERMERIDNALYDDSTLGGFDDRFEAIDVDFAIEKEDGDNRSLAYTSDLLNGTKNMPTWMTTDLAELLIDKIREKEAENAPDTTSLDNGPTFEKHMAERHQQIGKKILEAQNESDGFRQFERSHPELAREMRGLGIPLNERGFREQGYSFYPSSVSKDSEGKPTVHIRRETSEFRKWKKEHPGEEPPANMRQYAPIDEEGYLEALQLERDIERDHSKYPPSMIKTSSKLDAEREKLLAPLKLDEEKRLLFRYGYWIDEDDLRRCKKLGINPKEVEERRFQRAAEVVSKMSEKEMDEVYELLMGCGINWNSNYDEKEKRLSLPYSIPARYDSDQVQSLEMVRNHELAQKLMLRDIAEGTRTGYKYSSWEYKGRAYEAYPKYTRFLMDEIGDKEGLFESLEIDTDDEGVRKRALVGFINTLRAKNGEKTNQANWYFEEFKFAENWDDFLSAMAGVKENFGVGFQRKLTMFLNRRDEWGERNRKIKEEKEARKVAEKDDFARLGDMREVSLDYINEYVDGLREDADLDGEYFPVKDSGAEHANGEEDDGGLNINIKSNPAYGKMKVAKLGDWCNYIEESVDPKAKFYIESVGSGDSQDRGEYLALQFTMGDKIYCIAESIKDNAAMYIASGKAGEDIREYFRTLSKQEARRDDHVDVIYHLDKENISDSLDQCYAKAFFLLFGGKKSEKDFGKAQVFPVGPDFNNNEV